MWGTLEMGNVNTGNLKQDKAWVKLFKAILEENGYYETIRAWAKKRKITLHDLACEFYSHMDEIPDGMSPYFYLDTFEDNLALPAIWGELNSVSEVIEFIYEHFLWKE